MIRYCKKHGLVNHFERKDNSWRCGKCASKWVINSRIKKKIRLVEALGSKCKICGYNRYVGALDFHHLDRSKKKFSLSVKGLCYSWESIFQEAQKCIILCKNCHAEVENGIKKLKI